MERRRAERIAWVISGCSLLGAVGVFSVYAVGWLPETTLAAPLLVILLLTWLLGMIAAITYSEDGWTPTGTKAEWAAAIVLNPILAVILFNSGTKSPEEEGIDLDDHKRLSRL